MEISNTAASTAKESVPGYGALNVGVTLRDAREAQGMSVHDIAERIKFAPKQVEALEANDFAHLPQATFLRGFVRSYARVLQLDEASLLAALPSEPARQVVAGTQAVNVAFPGIKSLHGVNMLWLAGAFAVVLLLGLFILLSDNEPTSKVAEVVVEPVVLPSEGEAASAVTATEAQAAVADKAVPDEPKMADVPRKPDEPKKVAESRKVDEPRKLPEPAKVATPAKEYLPSVNPEPQIEGASAPVAAKPPIPLEVLKRRPLHFVFNESAWAEVLDSRGVVLLSRTNPKGTEKWVGGPRHEPYDISIAHPANVKLFYRGKEIDLSAYAGMDVVHLKLE